MTWECVEHGEEYVEGCSGCEQSIDFNDDEATAPVVRPIPDPPTPSAGSPEEQKP